MFAWVEKMDRKQRIGAAAAVLLAAAALFVFLGDRKETIGDELILENEQGAAVTEAAAELVKEKEKEKAPQLMVIDVEGAVCSPGVVKAGEGSRVYEAVELAGGLAADADASSVNLARILNDGELIRIPTKEEAAAGASSMDEQGAAGDKINLNTADSETLQRLSGVGPATAERIIEDRKENGPYGKIEDLKRVSGIGEKTFDKWKDKISVR